MKNTTTKMKNILQGINSRVGEAEEQIISFHDKEAQNIQSEQQKEKQNPKKLGLSMEPLGQLQAYQHSYHGVQEGKEREQEIENLFK